ncbi:MAG: hypothetical protein DRN91_09015 [Candidatus Alkanophagales archaeon]|mgnify:CR=1 FL=1|nr:MAG: hypothetical protein DRN91_09015 [Candidatus Alkanophagales archaeon]
MSPRRIERRLRLRRRSDVPSGVAKLNPQAMKYLGIIDKIEIVIVGGKRLTLRALAFEQVPENEVWCNEDELRSHGIADRTIATCRAPLKQIISK